MTDKDVYNKLKEYEKINLGSEEEHFSLHIQGLLVELQDLSFKGEKVDLAQMSGRSDMFERYILINSVEQINW